jgi:hypothetical protein
VNVEVTVNPDVTVQWRRVTPPIDHRVDGQDEAPERWEAYRTMPGADQYARLPQLDAYTRSQLGTLIKEAVDVPAVLNFEVPARVGQPPASSVYWQLSKKQQDEAYRETKVVYARKNSARRVGPWTEGQIEEFNGILDSCARAMVADRPST